MYAPTFQPRSGGLSIARVVVDLPGRVAVTSWPW